jgi:hypothetical protein
MNPMIIGNIFMWCLFALALAWAVAFASVVYEDLIERRKHEPNPREKGDPLPAPVSEPKSYLSVAEKAIVRGYDSDELFREDLWLRRLAKARRQTAGLNMSTRRLKASLKSREDHVKQLCAKMAHHAGAKFDN